MFLYEALNRANKVIIRGKIFVRNYNGEGYSNSYRMANDELNNLEISLEEVGILRYIDGVIVASFGLNIEFFINISTGK